MDAPRHSGLRALWCYLAVLRVFATVGGHRGVGTACTSVVAVLQQMICDDLREERPIRTRVNENEEREGGS
jgi:hypothetical protein